MPAAKLKSPLLDTPAFQERPRFGPTLDRTAAGSPARALQDRLDATLAPDPDRWSSRGSLALIVTSSFALWAAILMLASQAVHAIV